MDTGFVNPHAETCPARADFDSLIAQYGTMDVMVFHGCLIEWEPDGCECAEVGCTCPRLPRPTHNEHVFENLALEALAQALLRDSEPLEDYDITEVYERLEPLMEREAYRSLGHALELCPAHHCDIQICLDDERHGLDIYEPIVVKHSRELAVGARVRLRHDVDRYPHFIAGKSTTGLVVQSDEDIVRVHMDEYLPGAEPWDNEVCWYPCNGDDVWRDVQLVTEMYRDHTDPELIEKLRSLATYLEYVPDEQLLLEAAYRLEAKS